VNYLFRLYYIINLIKCRKKISHLIKLINIYITITLIYNNYFKDKDKPKVKNNKKDYNTKLYRTKLFLIIKKK